jgi:hypothetical protein
MGQILDYAKRELEIAGYFDGDEYNKALAEHVLKLLELFSSEGHSGFSAAFTTRLFSKLSKYEPLTPLTGGDDEWTEVSDGLYQNKRYSSVFKENGVAYDSEGIIFIDKNGSGWTSRDSRKIIEFPYTPEKEYVTEREDFEDEYESTDCEEVIKND